MVIRINKNKFNVKTVLSEKDISFGMMGKKFTKDFNGMLFIMSSGFHSFWMKNCIIPLDIVFIRNGIINKIFHNCPPCNKESCINYVGNGDMVLELMGGTCKKLNITSGDVVDFN